MECSINDCMWYFQLFFAIGIVATAALTIVALIGAGIWIKDVGDAIIDHCEKDEDSEVSDENPPS